MEEEEVALFQLLVLLPQALICLNICLYISQIFNFYSTEACRFTCEEAGCQLEEEEEVPQGQQPLSSKRSINSKNTTITSKCKKCMISLYFICTVFLEGIYLILEHI